MRSSVYKRAASLLICVAFLFSVTFVKPQKADAIAISGTAAVVASVAAIMTACGVTYWANTQQDAISYLGGKIDDYLYSLSETTMTYEEWLGISGANQLFTVIGNGVLSFGRTVANKVLDFVRWYNQGEGVVSNGQPVGELGSSSFLYDLCTSHYFYFDQYGDRTFKEISATKNMTFSKIQDSDKAGYSATLTQSMNAWSAAPMIFETSGLASQMVLHPWTTNRSYYYGFSNAIPTLTSSVACPAWNQIQTNNIVPVNKSYKYLWIWESGTSSGNYAGFSFTWYLSGQNQTPDTVVITPSSSVSVPQALAVGQSLDISTNANVSQGDSVDDTTTAILETVVTAGGLSSSNDVSGEAVPSESIWLWDAITSLPETIASALKAVLLEVFVPDQAFIDDFFANLNSIFDNRFSILSFPFALLGTFITKVASMSSSEPIISWPNIYEHFSGKLLIAAGSYNLNSILANQAIANMYAIYMIVVKAIISFQFVAFLYAWFCDVFHMHNDDFANPFDIVEETDPEDGDGYDGSWSAW